MTDTPNNVSNKEALKDKIHEIHNYLRNNGAGYGMNALKVFNIIYGLKKIEETGLLDTVRLMRPTANFHICCNWPANVKTTDLPNLFLAMCCSLFATAS